MKRIKPQYFLILLLVAAIAAAPFLIRGLIDRSSVGKQPAAAVTAAPEETAEPTPTPEPTPLQFTTVDASYFDDALFIGDSRTVGIAEYGSLKNATYFADVGLNVYVAQTKAVAVKNVGTVKPENGKYHFYASSQKSVCQADPYCSASFSVCYH